MRVTHLNSYLSGGAATAARRLHESLIQSGVNSHFFCSPEQVDPEQYGASYHPTSWRKGGLLQTLNARFRFRRHRQKFKRAVRDRSAGHEIFTSPKGKPFTPWPPSNHPASAKQGVFEDVVHLHWIAKFIDYRSFFGSLDADQPVIWTLHDMNAFTGGCHFSAGCDHFLSGCGHCHQLSQRNSHDMSRVLFAEKLAALANVNLNIVAPSRWLIETARSSPMFANARSFRHIPYGIDSKVFYPMDRSEARARLGIASDATVVCFGAMDIKSIRKGGKEMLQALSMIADIPNVVGMVFGSGTLPESDLPLPPIHSVGPVAGALEQRTVFSAADIFVLPSLEDNLPLTGLESMACGTPIVGFDAGGIPDYVRPNVSGWLAKTGDAVELGEVLRRSLSDPSACERLGHRARKMIQVEYSHLREAEAYADLYATLLGAAKPLGRAAA
ncbi:Capsular glucan synthase [Rubripirellula amarantea]|uniref:Capsular glucan synthase n=1 Tax=Rubripirellula amarantea TaxID=2527999 RepID=A0A5C5WUC6_9BACT|nr:glycosyltransferase [Rubripirellula amarantea]TWT53731.1 Capsular glucan synthase [Rubripirellula amarantea]